MNRNVPLSRLRDLVSREVNVLLDQWEEMGIVDVSFEKLLKMVVWINHGNDECPVCRGNLEVVIFENKTESSYFIIQSLSLAIYQEIMKEMSLS